MGIYSEYLGKKFNFQQLQKERQELLAKIGRLRDREVLVYAADLAKAGTKGINASIEYPDILAIQDQIATLQGKGRAIDIIVESPGGIAEVAEDIIRIIRGRYEKVGMIVPGWAKSAGTILVMAGDEILMGETSALGPIDPQILSGGNGKRFSADAFLEGFEKIKKDVADHGKLNPAYIPILQNISPGELQNCDNAKEFSQTLVRKWLAEYKFKYWTTHTDGSDVTVREKETRAARIAKDLCQHSKWLTHGRSLRREDLETLGLKITDYSKDSMLNDAITRYYTLLRISFETNMYKLFETPTSSVMRFFATTQQPVPPKKAGKIHFNFKCPSCQTPAKIQANAGKHHELEEGCLPFPLSTNIFECPNCKTESNLTNQRLQMEAQFGSKFVP